MPNLLYIDTSAGVATVAISVDEIIASKRLHENTQEQAAVINSMIDTVISESGLSIDGLDGICVCAGPGSYTGLRIGLATAKGIAFAADKPLLLFNKLDLIASEFYHERPIAVALTARTNEYFFAQYDRSKHEVVPARHIFQNEMIELIKGEKYLQLITDDAGLAFEGLTTNLISASGAINIENWLQQALNRMALKQFDDLAYSEPFYLKAAYTTTPKKK